MSDCSKHADRSSLLESWKIKAKEIEKEELLAQEAADALQMYLIVRITYQKISLDTVWVLGMLFALQWARICMTVSFLLKWLDSEELLPEMDRCT